MLQAYNCTNCANRKDGTCEYHDECKFSFDAKSDSYNKPTHWKPIEECIKPDTVNHPSHYETGKFECFDVMVEAIGLEEVKGFCLCNAFKYIYRCKSKHETPIEDVKKAVWYLNKFIELEGENGEQS
jgi:hypothetical protein